VKEKMTQTTSVTKVRLFVLTLIMAALLVAVNAGPALADHNGTCHYEEIEFSDCEGMVIEA
jgi:hypothetical protein